MCYTSIRHISEEIQLGSSVCGPIRNPNACGKPARYRRIPPPYSYQRSGPPSCIFPRTSLWRTSCADFRPCNQRDKTYIIEYPVAQRT